MDYGLWNFLLLSACQNCCNLPVRDESAQGNAPTATVNVNAVLQSQVCKARSIIGSEVHRPPGQCEELELGIMAAYYRHTIDFVSAGENPDRPALTVRPMHPESAVSAHNLQVRRSKLITDIQVHLYQ
eukprot:748106-Hanusia_phi.AAC.2